MSWECKLSDEEDIERSLEGAGDFVGHRDAAGRQPEHDDIVPALEVLQPGGQFSSGITSIPTECHAQVL
jgi:hypothetical protein